MRKKYNTSDKRIYLNTNPNSLLHPTMQYPKSKRDKKWKK